MFPSKRSSFPLENTSGRCYKQLTCDEHDQPVSPGHVAAKLSTAIAARHGRSDGQRWPGLRLIQQSVSHQAVELLGNHAMSFESTINPAKKPIPRNIANSMFTTAAASVSAGISPRAIASSTIEA